jgi:2-iminobutanoate/2-iminopropanoate deaminase
MIMKCIKERMKKIILFQLLLIPVFCLSQTDTSIVKFFNPSSVSVPKGYSHLVQIDLGNCKMLLTAGQVALDKQGNLVGKGDLAKQTEQVFTNIKNIVEEAGGNMDDLVKISFYIIDVGQIQVIRNVRDKFINLKNPPASTLVQVSKLFRDDLLIEIEATAVIPKK